MANKKFYAVRKGRTQKEAYDWIPRTRQQRREAVRETAEAVAKQYAL